VSRAVQQSAIGAHGWRVVSAVILGLLALGATYVGGPLFLLVWTIAALIIFWEWATLVNAVPRNAALILGGAGLLGAEAALAFGVPIAALLWMLAGAVAVAIFVRPALWTAGGVLYAAALVLPAVILRDDPRLGLVAILFLFAVVWVTDMAALYAGRYFGGAKLAPKISPAKTWSGAVGGAISGVVAGIVLLTAMRFEWSAIHVAVALAVTIVAQLGDLFESWVKRQFGVKDASGIIPGHGGLMDRLDSFIAAVLVATIVGTMRGGIGAPAQGLLQW
jgi:phosphatidate cytidylyltransferase